MSKMKLWLKRNIGKFLKFLGIAISTFLILSFFMIIFAWNDNASSVHPLPSFAFIKSSLWWVFGAAGCIGLFKGGEYLNIKFKTNSVN